MKLSRHYQRPFKVIFLTRFSNKSFTKAKLICTVESG